MGIKVEGLTVNRKSLCFGDLKAGDVFCKHVDVASVDNNNSEKRLGTPYMSILLETGPKAVDLTTGEVTNIDSRNSVVKLDVKLSVIATEGLHW